MAKTPTIWIQNPAKDTPLLGYSDSTTTYKSTTVRYSGIDVTLPEFDETPTDWAGVAKNDTAWLYNSAFDDNAYPYDSAAHTYDSNVDTFDGVVTGESSITTSTPTLWAG